MSNIPKKTEEEPKDESKQEPEKVLVDKITLDNILTRLQELEQTQTSKPSKRFSFVKDHTAKVRFAGPEGGEENEVVVGYGKTWEKTDLGGRRYLMIEVFTKDSTGKKNRYEKEYVTFMEQGRYVDAKILKVNKQEIIKELGSVTKTKIDYNEYRSEDTGEEVPLTVTSIKSTYEMELPDKTIVELPEEAIN